MPPSVPPIKWGGDVEGSVNWSFRPSQMRPGDMTFIYRALEGGREYHIHKQTTAPTKEDHAEQEGVAKKKLAKIKAKREKRREYEEKKRRKAKAKKERNSANRKRRR